MGFIIQVKTLILRRLSVRLKQVGIKRSSCFQVWLYLLPYDHHPFPRRKTWAKDKLPAQQITYKTRRKNIAKVMEYKEDGRN
jgi:hypothetical protein